MGGNQKMDGAEPVQVDRGASLVEMALVLPLLLMLLLGIVSAGVAYNHQLALTHAAREAARYGATLPIAGSPDVWLDAVHDRAVEAATGSLTSAPGLYICVAFVGTPDGTSRSINNGATESSSCFTESPPRTEGRVQVRVGRDVDFNALVFQTTLTIGSEAVNRFEAALGT
jgi:Flp pilus assembly protein TadG